MTYAQLKEKFGFIDEEKNWYQHKNKNGGGWVHSSAHVDETAFIGENAVIFSGNARVYGDAQVYGNAWVYGDAQVYGNAWVYGDAQVSGDAQVYGNACVSGNAWEKSPLFIIGSRHSLTNAKHGYIQIGCHCKKIDWWLENYKDIGEKENYSKEEISEYGAYIKLFKEVGK